MSASNNRMGWALLILRLALGLGFLLSGWQHLRHDGGAPTMASAMHWMMVIGELVCGAFMVIGLWMPFVCIPLLLLVGWPLVHGWIHGAGLLADTGSLFRMMVLLASALAGPGKWAVGKD
jgi:uncharacterized membrane protein YphA (DoxX/SURF4 family)